MRTLLSNQKKITIGGNNKAYKQTTQHYTKNPFMLWTTRKHFSAK